MTEDRDAAERRLQHDLDDAARRLGVAGASIALATDGHVLQAQTGVVNTRTGVEVTPDSLFMIQSITKVLTATLVLQLVDAGLVGLDDPVRLHLPDFRTTDREASERITVRHLLTHTGGFEGDLWAPTTSGPDALERFVADLVSQAEQHSAPGERFSYCNAGYGTLGRLVEVLRSMTYEEALRHHLAEPLGITELAFNADQALAFRTAIGHVDDDADGAPQRPLLHWAVMPPSNPAAGNQLAMSARDLLAFAQMHLRGGLAADGTVVLSRDSVRLMRQPQVSHPAAMGPDSRHGLGWWLQRGALVEHGGGMTGVTALLRTSPDNGVAAAAVANSERGGAMIQDVLEPWFADLPGVVPRADAAQPAGSEIADVGRYTGRYVNRQVHIEVDALGVDGLTLTTTPLSDSLDMAVLAGAAEDVQRHEVRRTTGNQFTVVGGGPTVEFLAADADGRAGYLFFGGRAVRRVA